MILHGFIVICVDVNCLFSAWQGRSAPLPRVSNDKWCLAGDGAQRNNKPNCNRNSSISVYLNFGVFSLYKYIYINIFAHTSCTLAYTSRHTVHTPHTDKWLVVTKKVSIIFGLKKN